MRAGRGNFWLSVGAIVLAGCASTPRQAPLTPIPPNSQIRVAINVLDVESPNAWDAGEAVGRGAAAGAGVGFGGGAVAGLELSIACGPYFYICASMAVVGAAGAAAVGAVGGSAYGASIALPAEKANALEGLIDEYLSNKNILEIMRNDFAQRQQGRWQLVESSSGPIVTLGVEALGLDQFAGDELMIRMTSFLRVRYGPGEHEVTKRMLVKAQSDRHHVDYWIADSGANLEAELNAVLAENSRQIVAVLSQPLRNGPSRKTIFGVPRSE